MFSALAMHEDPIRAGFNSVVSGQSIVRREPTFFHR